MECHSCPVKSLVDAFVAADLERNLGRCQSKRLKDACKKMQEAMQNVCLTCVEEVNDNNPSNHGQTFFSLDSGHCQSSSGNSHSSHSDNNEVISRADWINSHAAYDSKYFQDNSFRSYSSDSPLDQAFSAMSKAYKQRKHSEQISQSADSVSYETQDDFDARFFDPDAENGDKNPFQDEFSITKLPSAVEAILIREMNNFAALPPLHQMQICCLLAGRNLSDFARMGWLPQELKKWMKPKPKDEEVISAQTSHAIYQTICKKLPYLTVLARSTKKRSKERVASQNAAIKEFQKANGKIISYLNSPQDMKRVGKPTENPHETIVGNDKPKKKVSEKKARQEYLAKKYKQTDLFGSI